MSYTEEIGEWLKSIYSEDDIGEKLKKWAKRLCILVIVLCIIGAIVSFILFIIISNSSYNEYGSASLIQQSAYIYLAFIPILILLAILSPAMFGRMYAMGVSVIELQKINSSISELLNKNNPENGETDDNVEESK